MANNKGARFFFSRYKSSAKRILLGSLLGIGITIIFPPLAIAILASLPVTLTIGALIKATIDYRSRKPLSANEIAQTQQNIDNMDDRQVSELTDQIQQYVYPKSSSSAGLRYALREAATTTAQTLAARTLVIKDEHILKALGEDALQRYGATYVASYHLPKDAEHDLQRAIAEEKQLLDAGTCTARQAQLKRYMGREHNNGKRTMGIIHGFFEPKNNAQSALQPDSGRQSLLAF